MAGVDTGVFCEGECHQKLNVSDVAERKTATGKLTASTNEDCDCAVNRCHNNPRVPDPMGENFAPVRQSRRENFLPNGCLKHKLGENGLISHSVTADLVGDAACKSESAVNSSSSTSSTQYSSENTESTSTGNDISLVDTQNAKSERADDESIDFTKDSDLACCSSAVSDLTLTDCDVQNGIEYVVYESELQMPNIMRLITKDLSEPYSIYTYRYFIHNWPKLCFLAMSAGTCVGAIVCKLDMHKKMVRRGYIAMLAIDSEFRRKRIGSHLVLKAIKAMITDDCDEVVLETEITNKAALRLYENLGFVRDKRLFRYYLNGVDALRLKLWLR